VTSHGATREATWQSQLGAAIATRGSETEAVAQTDTALLRQILSHLPGSDRAHGFA
jgi:hypothetical protein